MVAGGPGAASTSATDRAADGAVAVLSGVTPGAVDAVVRAVSPGSGPTGMATGARRRLLETA